MPSIVDIVALRPAVDLRVKSIAVSSIAGPALLKSKFLSARMVGQVTGGKEARVGAVETASSLPAQLEAVFRNKAAANKEDLDSPSGGHSLPVILT